MNGEYKKECAEHSLSLNARKELKISGVEQVVSFDDASVDLLTSCGEMEIDGTSLNIDALDLERGFASISGEISGINYIAERVKKKKRFWGGE